MADQNCSSPSSPSPVIITSTSEQIKSDVSDSNSLSYSRDSKSLFGKSNFSSDEKGTSSSQSNMKFLFGDSKSSSEYKNGVSGTSEKDATKKSILYLRPSLLSSDLSLTSKNVESNEKNTSFSFKKSGLSLATSKFGGASFTSTSKNEFNSMGFGSEKNETSGDSNHAEKTESSGDSNNAEKTDSGGFAKEKSNKPALGIFSSNIKLNTNSSVGSTSKASVITVPNFVFGQNLHERVIDSAKPANSKEGTEPETKSNSTSDMLFSSVLTSKQDKDINNDDKFSHSKDSSSLIEDAARCQEARANKRKYEKILVTTGEESERNILQVNVKLFAFDNGTWIERGRGILRLNDNNCDESKSSRIVIRTVGSLRVVLNTKIWSGMSLSRASERSARLTAIDPNGQVKIYLIQASLKNMTLLYRLIEDRIKLCKEQAETEGSPQKKILSEKCD